MKMLRFLVAEGEETDIKKRKNLMKMLREKLQRAQNCAQGFCGIRNFNISFRVFIYEKPSETAKTFKAQKP